MTVTITIGWWAFPAIITIASILAAIMFGWDDLHSHGYMSGIEFGAYAAVAAIISLASWVVYLIIF